VEELVDRIGPGGYFGELGPLLGFPRAATARASAKAVVTGYTVRDFRELLGADRMAEVIGAAPRLVGRKSGGGRKRTRGSRR